MKNISAVKVQTPEPFNFKECLVYLSRSPLERLHSVENGCVTKLLHFGEEKILIQFNALQGGLEVKFLNCKPSDEIKLFVQSYIAEWFDFKVDLNRFYNLAEKVDAVDRLVCNFRGLRIVKIQCLLQALCWAIMGQQVNITFAYTLFGRFIETYGESALFQNKKYWLFPKAETIAGIKPEDLRHLQFTRMKAEYIIQIATLISSDELSRDELIKAGDFEMARKRLVSIRGVGPWTANYVLMRCLGALDAFPLEDVGLHNAIKALLRLKEKPDHKTIEHIAKSVPGWGSYLAFYLYRSLL